MKNYLYYIFPALFLLLFCSSSRKSRSIEAAIPVENERIYIAPLINQTGIEKIKVWPQNYNEQNSLLKNFTFIWKQLKSELQRCEKFGYYTVVDNDEHPTVRISITLDKIVLTSDSLLIPVNMKVEHIPTAKFFMFTLPTASPTPQKISADQPSIIWLESILSEYRRLFPYKFIAGFFYPQYHFDKK
ncbi:MAG TPA: hypothetical protein VHO70_21830 [Chitinispirillaceae bacterium]|nr:hypothetical protein [Chitinispirillaceae bacterium]